MGLSPESRSFEAFFLMRNDIGQHALCLTKPTINATITIATRNTYVASIGMFCANICELRQALLNIIKHMFQLGQRRHKMPQ
jgi:hypothetical protein